METTPRNVLLTGFEPFGGDNHNPSWDIVSALAGQRVGDHRIVAERLPVTFAGAPSRLRELLVRHDPALVICTGLAASRHAIALERVAVNLIDAGIPDNDGRCPRDAAVIEQAPAAYFSTLPLKSMQLGLRQLGCRAVLSLSADAYVCNATFFALMHALAERPAVRGGFIHLPHPKESAYWWRKPFAMPREALVAGLYTCVQIALASAAMAQAAEAPATASMAATMAR